MPKRMLVHDCRLSGKAPAIAQNSYIVDKSVSTNHVIDWVGQYAKSQSGLDELIIMCHGHAVMEDQRTQSSYPEPVGSSGLQLGDPGLTLRNAFKTAAWRPHIRRIYLYACGPSAPSIHDDPEFDGRRFCGELALHSGAIVYASERLQWYSRVLHAGHADTIDFGSWEGQVYCYSPATGQSTPTMLGAQPL